MDNKAVTVVIGASGKEERYSYKAVHALRKQNLPVIAIGMREESIADIKIMTGKPEIDVLVDTVSIYLSEEKQQDMIDYILSLKPRRIIFNPGAENDFLKKLAQKKGIHTEDACTLVLLSTGQY